MQYDLFSNIHKLKNDIYELSFSLFEIQNLSKIAINLETKNQFGNKYWRIEYDGN